MSGFWNSSDKIPVKQTTIKIPAENGLSWTQNQEIRFDIPDYISFFNPKDSYLEFKVLLALPDDAYPTYLQLDSEIGANVLIKTLTILDKNESVLEQIENFNTLTALHYDYHTSDSIRKKRALTEGSTYKNPATRQNQGGEVSYANDYLNNPYFPEAPQGAKLENAFTSASFTPASVCLPLDVSGILGNSKMYPNGLIGCKIILQIESNDRVFRQVDGAMRTRNTYANPIFHSTNGCSTTGEWAIAGVHDTAYFYQDNSQNQYANKCPFTVGEYVNFLRTGDDTVGSWTFGFPQIKEIEYVTGITGSPTKLMRLTFETNMTLQTAVISTDGTVHAYSKSVEIPATYIPTFTISDVNIVIQKVEPPASYISDMKNQMKNNGVLSYDFLTSTCYKYSQLASDRVATINIPIQNSRCKSLFCIPTLSDVLTSQENIGATTTKAYRVGIDDDFNYKLYSNRTGLVGILDEIQNYQFIYGENGGRLQPNRKVSLTKTSTRKSISAQPIIENSKALAEANIHAHSFKNFQSNHFIGRALSLGGSPLNSMKGSYDGRNKDFQLVIEYDGATAPAHNKLWLNYCVHIRRINVRGDAIDLVI